MKRILAIVVACVLAMGLVVPFTVSAGAASGTTGDCTWTLDDNGVLTISGNGAMGDYDLSSSLPWGESITGVIIEDGVTSIGTCAFTFCDNLTSVTIGNGVTSIRTCAFQECTSLTSVTIPDSVTSIFGGAFYGCTSLTSVYITDMTAWCNIDFGDEDANPLNNGADLYLNNNLVTKLGIPKGVTAIKDYAFRGCNSITSVTIPDNMTSIGSDAFYGCTSLTSVTIPDSVTSIGFYAFSECTSLTSVTIPDSVTTIGDGAFSDCYDLISVTIPDSVTSIGPYAFNECSSLTSVTIPDSVTSIGGDAFSECYNLTSVTIPDSVTSIGEYAFSLTSLTSVTIPYTVQSIGPGAFNLAVDLSVHEDSAGHTYALENSNPYTLTEHTYDELTTIPSTCTVAGSESGTCNVCGKDFSRAFPLAEHTFEGEAVVVPATCTTKGSQTEHCSVCEQDIVTVLAMVEHSIEDGLCTVCGCPDLQSEHPYADNLDQTWTHMVEGAGAISVTFSEDTYVEENIDYIYLYNSADEELGYYTGSQLAGQTVTVSGNTIKIRLVSDSSTNGYGFQVTEITSTPGIEQTTDGVIKLLQYIDGLDVGLTDAVADVNGDGEVTIFDAVRMLQMIAAQ